MSWYSLNETLITALRERLVADLPATIAEINAQVIDGYTLRDVEQVLDYVPNVEDLVAFPTVGIQDLPSRPMSDGGSFLMADHGLTVVVFVADAELRGLAWKLRRYQQAILTVALAGRTLGDAIGSRWLGNQPGPTLDREEKPRTYMSWAGVSLGFCRDEA